MTRAARLLTLSTRALALGGALSLLPVTLVGLPVGASGLPLVGAAQPRPVETSRAMVPLAAGHVAASPAPRTSSASLRCRTAVGVASGGRG